MVGHRLPDAAVKALRKHSTSTLAGNDCGFGFTGRRPAKAVCVGLRSRLGEERALLRGVVDVEDRAVGRDVAHLGVLGLCQR